MKKIISIGFLLIVFIAIIAAWLLMNDATQPSEEGFKIISLENNNMLISDTDILSYNWTSQEITITNTASERLIEIGDSLYSFVGFVVKINGEEIYRGVFRMAIHSAIPEPPRISILFPSMLFPSETENCNAIRMFYPSFEPPSDQPEANAKLSSYFKTISKLIS